MSLALLHTADPRHPLTPDPALSVAESRDVDALAALTGRARDVIAQRFFEGHRAFVATSAGAPAAFGWVATRTASMGELGITLRLRPDERYLWNFVTVPSHRGRGIYPRLLEAILAEVTREGARRVWIAFAPENHASASGIAKAGFTHAADLSFERSGSVAFRARLAEAGAHVAALLGVAEAVGPLTACWRCAREQLGAMPCAEGACSCDYQRSDQGCATGGAD